MVMNLEEMRFVFLRYFEMFKVNGVKITFSGEGEERKGEWEIPDNVFQLSKLANRIVFSGFVPVYEIFRGHNKDAVDAEVNLMFFTERVDGFSARSALGMFESLRTLIPVKVKRAAVPALVGSVSAAEQTNQILTVIQETLSRIEKSLLVGKPR